VPCLLCPRHYIHHLQNLTFKRHCDTMEAHPLKISFCDSRGRGLCSRAATCSRERHREDLPAECISITPEKAKRRKAQKAHQEFIVGPGRVAERCPTTGCGYRDAVLAHHPGEVSRFLKEVHRGQQEGSAGGSRGGRISKDRI
jgi:hypothetical protein